MSFLEDPSMNQNNDKVIELIQFTFQNRKEMYDFSEILEYDFFLEQKVLKKSEKDSQCLELNLDSTQLNEVLLNIAETELHKKLPDDIVNALFFVDDFENHLKVKYQVDVLGNEFRDSINALKAFTLTILNNKLSIYDYYLTVIKNKKYNRKERTDFVGVYFQFLIISNSSEETILKSCVAYINGEKYPSNYIYNFLRDLGRTRSSLAKKIVELGIKNDIENYSMFIANLLIGLYNSGDKSTFNSTMSIFEKDTILALKSFSSFNLSSSSEIEILFELINKIEELTIEISNLKSILYCNFIENDNTSAPIKENSLKELSLLLKSDDHKMADTIFHNVQYNLDNYEYEKYYLLHIYLNNTKNINVLKSFFLNFKNPTYLFDLLIRRYDVSGFRGSIDLFINALNHFLGTNKEETEAQILDLFNSKRYSLLGIKIILSVHSGVYPIDLLKLKDKEAQLFAIDSICYYPHSIDELLPLLLKLKESNFKEVIEYLKTNLIELIFEVYHDSLFTLIKKNLTNSKKDITFLIPLQKALDDYYKLRDLKASIKDLDPRENERNMMDLYYRLEHEDRTKMMKESEKDDNSFLNTCKTTVIVRATAWKNDDSESILPLGHFESSMMIDTRAYKNPTVYEQNLENF